MSSYDCDDIKEMSKHPDKIPPLERRVKGWIKRLDEILKESEQIRRENDSSGPQDELEYWKKRGAQFSQIVTQVNSNEVQLTILCLKLAHSKILKDWRETDKKITFCYNEAKDNAKFIQSLETKCHSLYLDDPVKMRRSIMGLLQTVRLIHSVSQFYNTSERTSALMVKITNQMIETCKDYLTCRGQESIWSQDRVLIKDKLTQCIILNKVYRKTYSVVKSQPFLPRQEPFNFSENYVFGKFDAFCRRLMKIISMFDLIDDYSGLFQRRMEGLLLGDALEEAIQKFTEVKQIVMNKTYDYLDQRNNEFENDFKSFLVHTDELRDNIAETIERNFDSVWETPQGIRFLTRFEKVSEKIPLAKMDEKYDRILKYCEKEVERIIKMYKKQKDDPPVPRMFPPIAGQLLCFYQ
nr:dynein heavy chain 5, axonemal-like [Leptinotarsa decemlineata]